MTTKIDPQALIDELHTKYSKLVWYARSHPANDVEYWKDRPEAIRSKAFSAQSRVEEDYHDDVIELTECDDNWQHGFNSGMLAAIRYMQYIQSDDPMTQQFAIDNFPDLDT